MKRFIAMLIATILMVGIVAATNGMGNGHHTEGLYYAASEIRPDAKLLKVNGDSVNAEEYFYWLAYDCEYLTSYNGDLDWDNEVSDGISYAQYAKADALEAVKLYTIVRQWAKQGGITLDENDQAALDAERQEYVEYYGGEEAYAQQIQLLGISEDTYNNINATYYLYNKVLQSFCSPDGSLYPGDEALQTFADENNYVTAKLLFVSTEALKNKDAIATKKDTAKKYAKKLQNAKDVDAVYAKLAKELGLDGKYPENGLTLSASDESLDAHLMAAICDLKEGEISNVISCDNGFYVAIRMPLDQDAVASAYFDAQLQDSRETATVELNDKLYDSINTGDFYTQLLQKRSELQQEFTAAAEESAAAADSGDNNTHSES